MSWVEVVTVLLSLNDFGVRDSARAPTAAEVLRLAPARADLVAHVDLAAFVPNNYATLTRLAGRLPPGSDVRGAIERGIGRLALGVGAVKLTTGVDPIQDVTSATGWVALENGTPSFLVVVRGDFPADLFGRDGVKQTGAEGFEVEGARGLVLGGVAAAHIGRDLVIGHRPWVEERMRKGWRRAAGPGDAAIQRMLRTRPFFALLAEPSTEARAFLARQASADADTRWILAALDEIDSFEEHFHRRGIGWSIETRSAAAAERARLLSQSAIDFLRAYQFFGLGVVHAGFGVLPALRERFPAEVAAIESRQRELLALAESFTGDGKFVATVAVDRRHLVTAEARGKSIGEVVGPMPYVALIAGAIGFMAAREATTPTPPVVETPAKEPSRVLDVGAIYRRVKAAAR